MFCPDCGAENQTANAYCKRCGDWLPDLKRRSLGAFGGETPQQNIFTGLFLSGLSAAVALFSAIALYATYLGTNEAKWSIDLAAGFCLCIAGWQSSSFFVTLRLRKRFNDSRQSLVQPSELSKPESVAALNAGDLSAFVSTPSVTENTTELLRSVQQRKRDTQQ